MSNYYRMNKILEEEGTIERSAEEELSFVEHEADVCISKAEDNAEYLAMVDERG